MFQSGPPRHHILGAPTRWKRHVIRGREMQELGTCTRRHQSTTPSSTDDATGRAARPGGWGRRLGRGSPALSRPANASSVGVTTKCSKPPQAAVRPGFDAASCSRGRPWAAQPSGGIVRTTRAYRAAPAGVPSQRSLAALAPTSAVAVPSAARAGGLNRWHCGAHLCLLHRCQLLGGEAQD